MCGISGYLDFDQGVNVAVLQRMNNAIRHRGPDDEGYLLINEAGLQAAAGNDTVAQLKGELPLLAMARYDGCFLGLGHRRLSILDLSPQGHQPMSSAHGRYSVAFNGEIYNYIELRQQLAEMGYVFYTDCDTEVLLRAYEAWGEDCVLHFNGMWAFALWDAQKQTLFCSRDRLGVKPFHYYRKGNHFVFGSELKQLIQDPAVPRVLDEPTLAANLIYGISDYNERTLLKDVVTLPGGCNLTVRLDVPHGCIASFQIRRYWQLNTDYYLQDPPQGYAALIGEEFSRSVRWRLRSDAKIGALLSGGLDSSCIVAEVGAQLAAAGKDPAAFETFTSCYHDAPEHDERHFAQLAAQSAGCSWVPVYPQPVDIAKDFEQLTWHCEGITGFSVLALYKMLDTVAARGVKVVLNGQCGDETMFGYERYYAYYFADLFKRGKWRTLAREFGQASHNSRLTVGQLAAYYAYFNIPAVRNRRREKATAPYLQRRVFEALPYETIAKQIYPGDLRRLQYNELTATQLPHILRFDDRIYMAHAIESRVPFVDYRFVEAAAKIPPNHKIRNGYTKSLMREYIDDKLPQEVTWRTNKIGFSAPTAQWVRGFSQDYLLDLTENARSAPFFRLDKVRELLRTRPNDPVAANFIAIEVFMRKFQATAKGERL